MPFTFKLSVRLARMKALLVLAAAAALSACGLQDRRVTGPPPPDTAVVQVITSPDTVTLDPFQTRPFAAYGRTRVGDSVAVTVRWSASGGARAGTYRVIATQSGGTLADTAAVTITTVPVASVTVSPASASVPVGQTVQLTATPKDASGTPLAGRVVTWASSNMAVATVNGSGVVTGVAAGAATITATSEGKNGTATITVTAVAGNPGTVNNLAVAGVTGTYVTLSFTEVGDGTGQPAQYDIRYAAGTLAWSSATDVTLGTCATPVAGSAIGATRSCTVLGL